jgi:hypothetical protein
MTVYNITTKLNWDILADWLEWQKLVVIPEAMASLLFDDYKIYRLLEPDDGEGPTFVIQYFSSSLENCQQYISEYAAARFQKAINKWGDRSVSFQTILQLVN